MNAQELKEKVMNLKIWKKGDQRAPHKPLLLLYALSQIQQGKHRLLPYIEVHEILSTLLKEFGRPRTSYHPEHPFVRLKNDEIWELNQVVHSNNFSSNMLIQNQVAGGFTEEVFHLLMNDPILINEIALLLLEKHFPETIHTDILEAIDFEFYALKKRVRDKTFREKVLKAYGYSCAVCNFNVRLSDRLVGIEAAHIKWHTAGGPDCEDNGIALCSLHHKLFDRGVFTITDSQRLIVSEYAHGNSGFEEYILKYHDKEIRQPINPTYYANQNYLEWHVREVFRGPSRYY